jgi:hypothetical protein
MGRFQNSVKFAGIAERFKESPRFSMNLTEFSKRLIMPASEKQIQRM